MTKIKVSKEVDVFIKGAEEHFIYQEYWKERLLHEHESAVLDDWIGVGEKALCMKPYSVEQLRNMLYDGYEVEEQ